MKKAKIYIIPINNGMPFEWKVYKGETLSLECVNGMLYLTDVATNQTFVGPSDRLIIELT